MSVTKQHIIINDTVNIKNARNEIVYQYHKGEKVEILDTAKWYWITKHGAVWFSQAKHEAQVQKEAELRRAREHRQMMANLQLRELLYLMSLAEALKGGINESRAMSAQLDAMFLGRW